MNSLRLLDSYKNYVTFKTPTTILDWTRRKPSCCGRISSPSSKRAIATYEKKYQFKLNGPVQVEVYPDHEDFAVAPWACRAWARWA